MFISSLISKRLSWYHDELIRGNNQIQISPGLFDRITILIRVACKRKGVDDSTTESFVKLLETKKEFLLIPDNDGN